MFAIYPSIEFHFENVAIHFVNDFGLDGKITSEIADYSTINYEIRVVVCGFD